MLSDIRIKLGNKKNLLAFIPPVLFMAILYIIGEPYIYQVMTDPIGLLNGEVWSGLGSNLGVFIWACSASIAVFAGLHVCNSQPEKKSLGEFLILLGGLTFVLSFDDLFLVHDIILPHFGIHEMVTYSIYALTGCFILFRYLKLISSFPNILFLTGGSLFAASIFLDLIPPTPTIGFFEDAFKFVGIFVWSVYLIQMSKVALTSENKAI